MAHLKAFNLEFEEDGIKYKGTVKPIGGSRTVPQKFEILLQKDKEPFVIECTPDGWKSDDVVAHQSVVDAVGNYLANYYE